MRALFWLLNSRYWRRRPLRAVLVLASIALGVAAWTATDVLTRSVAYALGHLSTPLTGTADLYVTNGDAGVAADLAADLAGLPGVRAVRPLVLERILLPDLGQQPALLVGVDLAGGPDEDAGWNVQVRELSSAQCMRSIFLQQRPVLVGKQLAQKLGDEPQINILVAGRPFRLTRSGTIDAHGAAAALAGATVVLDCSAAGALLGRRDLVNRMDIMLTPNVDREEVRCRLDALLAGKAQVITPDTHDQRIQEMLAGLRIAFALCGTGALIVGLFLVYNVLAVGVVERHHDIGVLRSLGATRAQVAGFFLSEALALGLTGGLIGLPLGLGLARLCLSPLGQALTDVFVPLSLQHLHIRMLGLAGALAAGLATSILAGLFPAVAAAYESPTDVLRRTPPMERDNHSRLLVAGSLMVAACGVGCVLCQAHLPARYGNFGGLILFVIALLLAMPAAAAILARLLRPIARRWFRAPGRLAADNLARAPARTGLVITALAAGVTLVMLTAGLIQSNEAAVRSWVDRSVAGDLFVTAGGPLSASGQTLPLADSVARQLKESCPGITIVPMRFRYLDWKHGGQPIRILLLALDAKAYCAANAARQPPLPDLELYQRLCQREMALVSENFAALYHVRPGDRVTLPGSDGPVTLQVAGTVADYSCNRGVVIVDRRQYRQAFDAGLVDVFDAYLRPETDVEQARQALLHTPVAAEQRLSVLTRGELRTHILGMVRRLYGLAYSQEVVVGIVAVLGMLAALAISVLRRRRELGVLRALGATRGQILRSVLAEALLMGAIGTVLGLSAGAPLEWYTVRVLLFEESGFLCPVRFPWATAGLVAGLALVGGMAAGLGPAIQAMRTRVAEAVAQE